MTRRLVAAVFVGLALLFLAPVLSGVAQAVTSEYWFTSRVTTNTHDDHAPTVSGDRIVWTWYDTADTELYTWTPTTGPVRLTSDSAEDNDPRVSGDRVVWWSHSPTSDAEIWTWTPGKGKVQLTSNTSTDCWPDVSGDRVVWLGSTAPEHWLQVFTWTPTGGTVKLTSGAYCEDAHVSGDRVVWRVSSEAGANPPTGIYTWTPSGGTIRLTTNLWEDQDPVVSGDRVVWVNQGSEPGIYTWTPDGGVQKIRGGDRYYQRVQVSGDRVAWSQSDGHDEEVFTCKVGGEPVQLTSNSTDDTPPQVSGDRVVWCGYTGSDWKTYCWTPENGTVRLPSTSRGDGGPAVSGDRVAWSGSDGSDYEIYTSLAYPVTTPVIERLEPDSGTSSGGTSVVIYGSGFLGMTGSSAVRFGGVNASSYLVDSPTRITAVAPAHAVGSVDVVVTALGGSSDPSGHDDDFTYTTRYQQNDSRLAYRGTWTTSNTSLASGGSFRFSDSPGAAVTIMFEGTHFSWIAKTSPAYGEAKVTVDGDASGYTLLDMGTVNTVYRAKVFEFEAPEGGVHTVLIERTGHKNPGATAANIGIDAFDIVGTLLQAPVVNRYEQGDARMVYAGTWTASAAASASGGSFRFADSPEAAVAVPFVGTSLSWLAKKSPAYGIAKVSVDGGPSTQADLYSPGAAYRQKAWDTGKLATGLHWVLIEWTGDKNDAATDTNIGIDAVDVAGTLASATRFEQTNTRLAWAGTWTNSTTASASGGSFKFANRSGASVTVKFAGISCNLIAKKSPVYGIAEVKLDDRPAVLVDLYGATALFKQTVWKSGFLVPGDHVVTVTWTGTKRAAATDYNIGFDAVDVIGVLR